MNYLLLSIGCFISAYSSHVITKNNMKQQISNIKNEIGQIRAQMARIKNNIRKYKEGDERALRNY